MLEKAKDGSQQRFKGKLKLWPGWTFSRESRSKKYERAHMSVEDEEIEDHMLFSATEDASTITKEDVWSVVAQIILTREERYFSKLDKSIKVPIKVGNREVVMIAGKGDITVCTSFRKKVIRNVFLVSGLEKNLLSVPQIISVGYSVLFENKCCTNLDRTGKKIMEIQRVNKSFPIRWNSSQESELVTSEEEGMELWHRRLGHVGNSRMEQMHNKKMVDGFPNFHVNKEICGVCKLGKQVREAFPTESQTKTKEKLEIVHTNVCGPMQTESLNGSIYFLLLVDDYTHMAWIYFLKQKSEVFSVFKKSKALVETQSGKKIKRLRSDGGGEFTSSGFNEFCDQEGIERQVTVPYTHRSKMVLQNV